MGKRTRRQLETIRARLDALDARLRQYERPVYAINDSGWHVVAMSLDPIWQSHFIDARAAADAIAYPPDGKLTIGDSTRPDAPDDSPFTYYPTETGYIKQSNRAPDWTLTMQTPRTEVTDHFTRTPLQRAGADAPDYG